MSSRVQQQAGGGQAMEEGNNRVSINIGAATAASTMHTRNNNPRRHEIVWYDTGNHTPNNLTLRGRGRRHRRAVPGRHNTDFLIFSLAFAVVVSLVLVAKDLLSDKPINPVTITLLVLSITYCAVLLRRQRVMHSSETIVLTAADRAAAVAPGHQPAASTVLNKEARRAVFDYFIFRPPEEEKRESLAEQGGGGVGDKGYGVTATDNTTIITTPSTSGGGGGGGGGIEIGVGGGATSRPPPPYVSPPPPYVSPMSHRQRSAVVASKRKEDGDGDDDGGDDAADCELGLSSAAAAADPCGNVSAACAHGTPTDGSALVDKASGKEGRDRTPPADILPPTGLARAGSNQWSTAGACIVCFGEYEYGDQLCRLPCRHLYHAQCIDKWLDGANHAWCPLCKADLAGDAGEGEAAAAAVAGAGAGGTAWSESSVDAA